MINKTFIFIGFIFYTVFFHKVFSQEFGVNDVISWALALISGLILMVILITHKSEPETIKQRKERKQIKKEKYIRKTCSWCNTDFQWSESGCRYHCCRRCESQDA